MANPMLDIIVLHTDEPEIYGRRLFDMLRHQVSVNPLDVAVTVVTEARNVQTDHRLTEELPYPVRILTADGYNMADARNLGLKSTSAPWVMFIDYDDCLTDVCSLTLTLSNLPTDSYDVVWGKVASQSLWYNDKEYINAPPDQTSWAHLCGKMYRREFLAKHDIYFQPEMGLHCDFAFNAMCMAETPSFRIATLTTDIFPFFKGLRRDGGRRNGRDGCIWIIETRFQRDMLLADTFLKRKNDLDFRRTIVKAVCDEYYAVYRPELSDGCLSFRPKPSNGFLSFLRKYADVLKSMPESDVEVILSDAQNEVMGMIQTAYDLHRIEYYLVYDDIEFYDWVKGMLRVADARKKETHERGRGLWKTGIDGENADDENGNENDVAGEDKNLTAVGTETDDGREPRVVVYCGTRSVYPNMVASLKSLLSTTPVDKVYFLTEDDAFPLEIPDIVECINVSGQKYFPADGPNYDCAWTYMCMIRAAFPEIFPQYRRVLSLDIDIVVNDNVSDLWDYDMNGYYLAGVAEPQRAKSPADPVYINFGVVMMNLDKMRADDIQEQVIDLLNSERVDCPEQGAFNKVCAGHILQLPNDYNCTVYSHITGEAQRERILHYAGQRFWRHYAQVRKYSELPWDEIMSRQRALHEEAGKRETGTEQTGTDENGTQERNGQKRIVVYGGTRNTYEMMHRSLLSLLHTTKVDRVYLLIEDDSFPYDLPDCVTILNVSGQRYFLPSSPNYNSHFSYIPLLRAMYPTIFRYEDVILSVDNDVLFRKDASGLWERDFGPDIYIRAVRETNPQRDNIPTTLYYNTGVMLMNLRNMRRDGIAEMLRRTLNARKFTNDSQDAINIVCAGHIEPLPYTYNSNNYTDYIPDPVIRHYCGVNEKAQFWTDSEYLVTAHQ